MRMKWTDIVAQYPAQWALMDDCVMDGNHIVSAELIGVYSDDDIDNAIIECRKIGKKYRYKRTTYTEYPIVNFCALNARIEVVDQQ